MSELNLVVIFLHFLLAFNIIYSSKAKEKTIKKNLQDETTFLPGGLVPILLETNLKAEAPAWASPPVWWKVASEEKEETMLKAWPTPFGFADPYTPGDVLNPGPPENDENTIMKPETSLELASYSHLAFDGTQPAPGGS